MYGIGRIFTPIPASPHQGLRGVGINSNCAAFAISPPFLRRLKFSPSRGLRRVGIDSKMLHLSDSHPHPNLPPSRGKGLDD